MQCEYLWAFNTQVWQPTKRHVLFMLSAVCREEIDRINQFSFKNDFKLCLVGRIMMRKCIHLATNLSWKDIKLGRSEKGKPELLNRLPYRKNFFFNISHDGDYTVLAASTKCNIGIDIMKFSRPNNTDIPSFFKLMKRQFVDSEWEYILSHSTEHEQLQAFYRLWCLKESYVKAVGTGIGTSTASYMRFEVSEKDWNNTDRVFHDSNLFINNSKMPWKFQEFLLDDNHIATIAIDNTNAKEIPKDKYKFQILSLEELLEGIEVISPENESWWEDFSQKDEKK